jgi:hypothetical protein
VTSHKHHSDAQASFIHTIRIDRMLSVRTSVAALAAAATMAAPLTAATTADASTAGEVDQAGPVIELDVDWFGVALSPDGDHSQDKARINFGLARKSEVVVKIRRSNPARTLVYKEKLGEISRGDHTWAWKGKNLNGKVVRDGQYNAVFVADQVAEDGKKRIGTTAVYVDTTFDVLWAPRLSADTVYPNTQVPPVFVGWVPGDFIGMTLGSTPDDPMTALGKVVLTVEDAQGRVVSKGWPFQYHHGDYADSMPLAFRGLDAQNKPLPSGTYQLRFTVRDMAGNPGGAQVVTVRVSDKPLVEATGFVVVPPTGSSDTARLPAGTPATTASTARDGRSSMKGGDDVPPMPCGKVVPSEVYTEPGASSFRSSDTCIGYYLAIATADGSVDLAHTLTPEVAPRGLRTSWMSMRGKPTVAGETDTAKLSPIGGFLPGGGSGTSSATVAGETVTTTPAVSYPFEAAYFTDYTRSLRWTIETRGTDSYDVAAVTVYFTYLTPQK